MKINYSIIWFSIFLVATGSWGCYQVPNSGDIVITDLDARYAIPLINTTATILDIEKVTGDNTSIEVDDEGRITVLYTGEVLRDNANNVFPPVPGSAVGELPLVSASTTISLEDLLPFEGGFILKKAIFSNNTIQFRIKSSIEQKIDIQWTIPELKKDNEVFSKQFSVYADGDFGQSVYSIPYDLDGWIMETDDNSFTVIYEAVTDSGELIVLDEAAMEFSLLAFKYVEGFFTQNGREESGAVISIGVYSTWMSGGLDFEDPQISINVDNAFGFPVRSTFNKIELITVDGARFELEGEIIDSGFDFNYPSLDQVGETVSSQFVLDKNNSNIKNLFNNKIVQVNYDVTATGNPDNDDSIIGFVTDSSYYNVDIAVQLPLEATINNLVLGETFEINLSDYDQVDSIEFKLLTDNRFPFDIELQAFFLDQDDLVLDSLFQNEAYHIDAAIRDNETLMSSASVRYVDFDADAYNQIVNAHKISVRAKFMNGTEEEGPQWIYEDYGIDIQLGAIIKIEK